MIYLTTQTSGDAKYVSVTDVSNAINSPKHFTGKILQQLSRADLIESVRGPHGGFCMPQDSIVTLADIVRVIDGNQLLDGCVLGFKECSERRPCPAHFQFKGVRDYLKEAFMSTDILEMKKMIDDGMGFLKF